MRKLLMLLLLGSAAGNPTLANPDDREGRMIGAQSDRDDSDDSQSRRHARSQRSQPAADSAAQSLGASDTSAPPRRSTPSFAGMHRDSGTDSTDTVSTWRARERHRVAEGPALGGQTTPISTGDLRQSDRPVPHVLRNRVPVVSNEPREGSQPPLVAKPRREARADWNTSWRRDHRYDWTSWRNRNHSRFHLGFYYDPFGWGYRPYAVGWRLWPSYYSSHYWLNDPYYFRLPYAPAGYRWIRYYDDAILVDTWNGEVVDVIYNFFW